MKKPRIILFDIESTPLLSYNWGKYEQNAIAIKRDWQLLSFAWKELGEGNPVKVLSRRTHSERRLVRSLHNILDEADILIAHNGDEFDAKKARAKFIEFKLPPPSPAQQIDTKKLAKSQFRFSSNKLDDLGDLLGVGRKMQTGGFDLWLDCMAGKASALRKMEAYNKQDVLLLERVYLKLRPWIKTAAIPKQGITCAKCGSSNLESRGYNLSLAGKSRRYQCRDCGGWSSGRKETKG